MPGVPAAAVPPRGGELPLDFSVGFRALTGRPAAFDPAMQPVFLCCLASRCRCLILERLRARRGGGSFPMAPSSTNAPTTSIFGKVIGFEARHDFHNGTAPDAAILIEPAEAGQVPQWGSCATCAATFTTEAR